MGLFRKRAQIDIEEIGSGFHYKFRQSLWTFRPLEGVAETQAVLLKKLNALIENHFEPKTAKQKKAKD